MEEAFCAAGAEAHGGGGERVQGGGEAAGELVAEQTDVVVGGEVLACEAVEEERHECVGGQGDVDAEALVAHDLLVFKGLI